MRREPFFAILTLRIALSAISPTVAADPPAKTVTKAPEAEETLSEAQQSLLLQLSDAEVNIRALNLALARTGYKVGLAYNQIESGTRGNAQMDRKGGGPVGWQDFYGKTARSFYVPDSEATLHSQGLTGRTDVHVTQGNRPIQRPRQFDYIYKANNDQVARAKEQVASLAQDQATLLARRQKHEADQSRLWAMLAFERITNREIADEPLCRFKLKSNSSSSDPRVAVLRAMVLFLRTADQVAIDSLESVKSDQAAAFGDLDPRMKGAYATLRASLADAMTAYDLKPEDKKQADALKGLCKQLWDESAIVADNYRNALDRDQAKEDNSKLVFRGKLQESLARFSALTAELDVQISDAAKAWSILPEKGTPTTDSLPQGIVHRGSSPDSPVTSVDRRGGWVSLFNGKDFSGWFADGGDERTFRVDGDAIVAAGADYRTHCYLLTHKEYANFVLRLDFNAERGTSGAIAVRAIPAERLPMENGRGLFDHPIFKIYPAGGGNNREEIGTTHWIVDRIYVRPDHHAELGPPGSWNHLELEVRDHTLKASINGKPVCEATVGPAALLAGGAVPGLNRAKGQIGIQKHTGTIRYRNIQIMELP